MQSIVNSTQVAISGTWSAQFHLSTGAKRFRGRYQEAIAEANNLLGSFSDFQCSRLLEKVQEPNPLVSAQVVRHTMASIAEKNILAKNDYEKTQVAIIVIGYHLETNATEEVLEIAHLRDELLKELKRIDEFLQAIVSTSEELKTILEEYKGNA